MTMPTPEPSPQILTERVASFNRADIKQSGRLRASRTDAGDVETTENLTYPRPSAQHVRHPSLELHPSALHPINLNSKFDHLYSPASPAKAFAKVPVVFDDQADKESSFICTPHPQGEDGVEPQEELSLEPHESLLQDTQEESCSTSISGETKSPRDCSDFILWGNAAFRLSEARTATGGTMRSQGHDSEVIIENHVQDSKQSVTANHMEGILLSRDEGLLPSRDGLLSPDNTVEASCLPTISPSRDGLLSPDNNIEASCLPTISPVDTMESSIVAPQGSVEHPSSVGSNFSGHNPSTFRHTQARHSGEPSKEEPLMSAEAQSYCRDLDADKAEASDASNCTTLTEEMDDSGSAPQETNTEGKDEEEMGKNSQESGHSGCGSSSCSDRIDNPERALIAAEEVKIRAELELEIERDLEREIKTKIYLLSRRLEELNVLKATRQPKQEISRAYKEETVSSSLSGQDHMATKVATVVAVLPKSPPPSKISKNKPAPEHSKGEMVSSARISLAPSKQQLVSGGEKDKDTPSGHANTPLTSWRKFTTASGWAPHTKDGSSHVPPDGSFKNMKISKNFIDGDGALKPKVQVESTSSFKPDYQSWTGIASSKKFDWIRTLRSDVSNSPQFSSMKTDGEESSAFLPSSKETLCGNVARTLFTEDGVSTPRPTILRAQRRESNSAPRRSVLSSSKTPALHADMVAPTPRAGSATTRLPKDNLRSASASRLTQKTSAGNQGSREPMHRNPELRQAKVTTTSKPASMLKASLQQASSRVSGIERKGSIGSVASTNQMSIMKNGSATHRSSGLPSGSARSISSKEIQHVPLKTPPKQVSPTSKSRVAPSIKSGTSTAQMGKVLPLSNVARRQSSLPLKTTGASTARPAFY